MSKTTESALWHWLAQARKTFKKELHLTRIENIAGAGAADVEGCFQGQQMWIELKCCEDTHTVRPRFEDSQEPWHRRRREAGGLTWILLQTGAQSTAKRYLIPSTHISTLEMGCKQADLAQYAVLNPKATQVQIIRTAAMNIHTLTLEELIEYYNNIAGLGNTTLCSEVLDLIGQRRQGADADTFSEPEEDIDLFGDKPEEDIDLFGDEPEPEEDIDLFGDEPEPEADTPELKLKSLICQVTKTDKKGVTTGLAYETVIEQAKAFIPSINISTVQRHRREISKGLNILKGMKLPDIRPRKVK